MTPEQTKLVQESFAKVTPIADQAAILFYDDLFERDPTLRPLFKGDMPEQRRKLMAMLATVVANLTAWDTIAPAVEALGQRHATYGVRAEHYATVGAALLATLEKGLGAGFTPEVRDAWIACYNQVSAGMLRM
jgi:nitric oxide dioxygenase